MVEFRRIDADLITPPAATARGHHVDADRRHAHQEHDERQHAPEDEADEAPEQDAASYTTMYSPDGSLHDRPPADELPHTHIDFRA